MFKLSRNPIRTAFSKISGQNRKGLFGVGWSSLAQVVGLVIKIASTFILTRMLAPEAYGILGTALAVLTTLEWLSDLGIVPALIRHEKGGSREYLLTGWWMGITRGAGLSLFAAIAAYPLSQFYGQPELLGVLIILAIRPLLMALRSPAFPLLRRNLNYKSICVDEISMTLVGTVCSILMAFVFQSVWAIVLGTMAGAITSLILSYVLVPMRPRFVWNQEAATAVYALGRQVFFNTLIMAIWLNLDRLLGLRILSPAEMGLYAVAFNLAAVLEGLSTRVCDVYFSLLARESGAENQSKWHNNVSSLIANFAMPLGTLMVVAAPWAIWILYDVRYQGAGLIFAILVARLMIRAFGQLQFQYLLAIAKVNLATYAYIAAATIQVIILWPMVQTFGIAGMAISVLVSTIVLVSTQTILLAFNGNNEFRPMFSTFSWATFALTIMLSIYGSPIVNQSDIDRLAEESRPESTVNEDLESIESHTESLTTVSYEPASGTAKSFSN